MDATTRAGQILDRNLSWVKAADAKVAPVFAVNAGLLGILGVKLPHLEQMSVLALVFWVLATAIVLASLVCLGFVSFPRLDGPKSSLVFFGTAIQREEATFVADLLSLTDDALAADLARQAYRNAQIASSKYKHLKVATVLMFTALPFWIVALALTRFFS